MNVYIRIILETINMAGPRLAGGCMGMYDKTVIELGIVEYCKL